MIKLWNTCVSLFARVTIIKVEKDSFLDLLLSERVTMWFEEYIGYVWLIIALSFLFAELNTPGLFFFISFAVGSLCAAVLAFFEYSFVAQSLIGLGVAIVTFFFLRKYLQRKKLSEVHYERSMTNIDALVGQKGEVTVTIELHRKGRVKVGGEEWGAQAEQEVVLQKGTVVKVLRVVGNTLVVKAVS